MLMRQRIQLSNANVNGLVVGTSPVASSHRTPRPTNTAARGTFLSFNAPGTPLPDGA
jgi:hypothetical protein